MTPITEHFFWEEARCPHCGNIPEDVEPEIVETARWLERIREYLGGVPMYVHSWYRCPEYNRKVGGAPNSQHLYGRAVDFTHARLPPREVYWKLVGLVHAGEVRGLGLYRGHVHVDRRPRGVAIWQSEKA